MSEDIGHCPRIFKNEKERKRERKRESERKRERKKERKKKEERKKDKQVLLLLPTFPLIMKL